LKHKLPFILLGAPQWSTLTEKMVVDSVVLHRMEWVVGVKVREDAIRFCVVMRQL